MTFDSSLRKPEPDAPSWILGGALEARAQSLSTINAIADTVYRVLDLKELVEKAVDVMLEYIPVTSVALFSLDPAADWLDLVAWRGFTEETLQVGSRLPVQGSLTGLTILRRDIVTNYDIASSDTIEPRVKQALLAQGLTGCISIPLLSQAQALGAANLIFHETHRLTPLERETLLAIGKTIGLAMSNAQHVQRVEAEIRERRRVEAELLSYQDHLAELVEARTADLEDANAQLQGLVAERDATALALREMNRQLAAAQQRAEQANAAKTVLLSNISHEIRTPLNVIIGYTGSMLNGSPIYGTATLPEIFGKDIQLIMDNGRYILQLIEDLLDMSKIEAGRLELHPTLIDLPALLDEVMTTSLTLVKAKPIQIRARYAGALPKVWADPDRVRQIALNLMSNAIKFTKEGSVTLSIESEGDFVRVAVADTGMGISETLLPYIFERFQASEATQGVDVYRTYGSTGLGLNISRQLTHLLGGDMRVSSTVGEGSIFSFTLPCAPDSVRAHTVLLVGSAGFIRETLPTPLTANGYRVLTAASRSQADQQIDTFAPEVIVLDVALDGLNSAEWIAGLRAKPATASILIAALADKFAALDVDLFFVSPVAPAEIVAAIDRILNRTHSSPTPKSPPP